MKQFLKLLAPFIFLVLLPASAYSQVKVGYINYDKIWTHAEPFVQAKERIDQEFGKRDKALKQQEQSIVKRKKEFERQAEKMSEAERRKKARELMDAEREFQRAVREFQEDFTQRQNEEIAALMDQVAKAIKAIAEREKYDLILQDAVYINPSLDITELLLDSLKKNTK